MAKNYVRKNKEAVILPRSTSFRINQMFSLPSSHAKMKIDELRELRDIAARDGDLQLAFKAAAAIDRIKEVNARHHKKAKNNARAAKD